MNANEDNAPVPDEQASAAPDGTPGADAPAAKPARKKRAPKAAAAAEADAGAAQPAAVSDEVAAAAGEESAPAKPARRKRAPAKSADEGVTAEAPAVEVAAEPVGAPVAAPKPRSRSKAAVAAPVAEAAEPVAAPAPAVLEAAVAASSDGNGAEAAGPAGEPGDEPQGERSRRRNRRDRKRGPREGGQADGAERAPRQASNAADDDGDDEDGAVAAPQGPAVEPADVGEVFAQVLSGDYDAQLAADVAAEGDDAPAAPHKRVLRPEPDAPKLQKVLAQSGVGSRRDMEDAIAEGRVMVNDQVAHTGQRISFGDRIKLDGKQVRVRIVPPTPRIIAYHKPAGEVVTHDDPQHRPTVFRRLPRLQQGKWQSVGRLDLNTEGLLLFTNSGELANQLMHPRFGVEREYAVRVLGTLESDAKAKLLEGVQVDGQTASFRSIEEGGGEGVNRWYRVVITEGRNREVRKLFDTVGLTVSRLIRIRYGTVVLPRGLKRGDWVDLEDGDVRAIRQLAAPPARQGQGDGAERGQNNGQGGRGDRDRSQRGARGGQGGDRNNNEQQPRQSEGRGPQQGRGPREDRGNGNGSGNGQGPNKRNGPPQRNNNNNGPRPQDMDRSDEPRRQRDDDLDDDFDPSRIPNPLEQTFDKRFVSNPRMPAGGKGFRHGGGGFGGGGSAPDPAPRHKGGGPREPDPLQTSVGYIGGEAFHRKLNRGGGNRQGQGGGGGGQGGNRGGFGGGGGGNGGKRRGR